MLATKQSALPTITMDRTQQTVNSTTTLTLFIGPMYSGKTSSLIKRYEQCLFCNIPVVVINSAIDIHSADNGVLVNHDDIQVPCVRVKNLMEMLTNPDKFEKAIPTMQTSIADARVVIINEGQFFGDLFEFVERLLSLNKQIIVGALDGDFKRQRFGQVLDLIPLCDDVYKLKSICSSCKNGTQAIFSKRITGEIEQTLVGSESYIPVCRACYEM